MNEENVSDGEESGTNKSRRYGVSFLCGGFCLYVGRVLCRSGLRCCVAIMRPPVSRARVANKVELLKRTCVFMLVGVVSVGASLLCCCHARAGVMRRDIK